MNGPASLTLDREPWQEECPRVPDSPSTASASASTHGHGHGHGRTDWFEAHRTAGGAAVALPAVRLSLAEALGQVLAEPLCALTDLPSFDTSAMDGWAVAGPGPWQLSGRLLAGQSPGERLLDGRAVQIATGAPLPPGASAVLRREHGHVEGSFLHAAHEVPEPGRDIRPRAQECRAGEALLGAGAPVTPAVLGLAAAAGYDALCVVRRPRVDVLVLGDELLERGLPSGGRVRDALGPLLPPWLGMLGAEVTAVRRIVDDADALLETVTGTSADLVVTTGGTAAGPADFVHPVLRRIGAGLLVDGVAVRPGHPMLLAELPAGGHLVGLPGNPLAAVSGVLTLVEPLLRTLSGRAAQAPVTAAVASDVPGRPSDTRLVPVALDDRSRAVPLRFHGPAMLRGLAGASGMAVVPPGGVRAGTRTTVLAMGWGTPGAAGVGY
ncbi:molybdopterin molybdotransferase MoeA [Streptomyces olivochromogenes]|uniref:molybdopterin molybdotransferase MoeA n=1 Tax=Streptomyces olivochromogenes TaxID=1963 RepID=UPI001F16163C|nr:molybdopterin molybdotransferase MoeA [Streptomyces olivochromogenes]MCF3132332.1 molybdopterin molybdotransferase MoeA [Streptomyces olivochromogenes]